MTYTGVACFWLEPTGRGRVGLRRFTFSGRGHDCPKRKDGGHDASKLTRRFASAPWTKDADGHVSLKGVPRKLVPSRSSASWPRKCSACGGPFGRGAEWQSFWALEYVRGDTGEKVYMRNVHGREYAGALMHVPWYEGAGREWHKVQDRGDGIILGAVCPNGALWVIDAEATGGGFWERTGDPRNPSTLTVSPSILAGDYHGFLQGGRFTDG